MIEQKQRSRAYPLALAALALSTAGVAAGAGVIASDRVFIDGWHHAGYGGTIPAPARIANVRDFGAIGDGVTNDIAAVNAARDSLGGNGVIYFPAGTYKLSSPISLNKDGLVVRGERPANTCLLFDANVTQHSLTMNGNRNGGSWQPVTNGLVAHSRAIEVADGTAFAPGDYAELRQENDPDWGFPTDGWQAWACGQMVQVAAVTNNTLTLERELRYTYDMSRNPAIRRATMRRNCGVENISMERLMMGANPDARDNIFTIGFNGAANCWVRGVELRNGFGGHVGAAYSTRIEVTGCYIHHAHEYDGGGSGYGVRLEYKTGEVLTENCIFRSLRHSMLVQAGVNGNVYGYNYSLEGNKDGSRNGASDITLHGTYAYANLFEGNFVDFMNPDNSHGANGPGNTFFRNRAIWNGFRITDTRITDANIVGNECRSDGGSGAFYAFFYGDGYALGGSGNFAYGNAAQNDGNPEPAGFTGLADYSYYLTDDPATPPPLPPWWTPGTNTRVCGPIETGDVPLDIYAAKSNPAKARYEAGGVMTVGPPSIAQQPTNLTVNAGEDAAFAIEAYGTPSARYRWYHDGNEMAGQTNAGILLPAVQPNAAGGYHCLVYDNGGSMTSSVAALLVDGGVAQHTITAAPSVNGSIAPSGTVIVAHGEGTNFTITPAPYYHIADVIADGTSLGPADAHAFVNVTNDRTIHASFAANLTAHATPEWWLAQHGLTNGTLEDEDTWDVDEDGLKAWEEWVAGTVPTNKQSALRIVGVGRPDWDTLPVSFRSVTGRTYNIRAATGTVAGTWSVAACATNPAGIQSTNAFPGHGGTQTIHVSGLVGRALLRVMVNRD